MVDQLASAETCRVCGVLPNKDQVLVDGLCGECAEAGSQASSDLQAAPGTPAPLDLPTLGQADVTPNPDNPPWGPITGVSVWLASVAAIFVVQIIAAGAWILIQMARGAPLPNFAVREEIEQWAMSPNMMLLQVGSIIAAHAITLALCWVVVTRFRFRPFWASLGSSWGGHSVWYWVVFSACILVALQLFARVLSRLVPEAESPFDQLLKTSQQVRIAVALLATFTAPLVEEVVYRGVLFSSLRRHLGTIGTVLVVTVTFAGVHVVQNRGAWVSIAGLTFLSLVLTIVRARTRSILPCVLIHTVNNAVASVFIVLNIAD